MIYMKFNEWNMRGFDILKGSKACMFENGEAVFSEEQVKPKDKPKRTQTLIENTEYSTVAHRDYDNYRGDCTCDMCKTKEYNSRHDPESISYTYTDAFGNM